jgi:poly-gamma-glutamate synthesis protein (capsule biosynthesis protein)
LGGLPEPGNPRGSIFSRHLDFLWLDGFKWGSDQSSILILAEEKPVATKKRKKEENLEEISIVVVGDVVISRKPPEEALAKVLGELKSGSFSCCNFEVPLSNRGIPQFSKFETLHADPEMIQGYVHGGFKVVSMANNHAMDYGPEALADTIDLLESKGILYAGAGKKAERAWAPVFFEEGGMRFSFLSFATEAFPGYGAHPNRPGIAVIRRDPLYGPTCINPFDAAVMKEKIKTAKRESDFTIVAFHWGLSQSRALTQSQLFLGRAAVNAGAGLVVGHHPHVLQGMEAYRGSLILYSMGNFVFDLVPHFFGPATRESGLVKVRLSRNKVKEAIFLPAWINDQGQPEFIDEKHPKNAAILQLMQKLSALQKTKISVKNGKGTIQVQK